jgi:hypothetical protein
LLSSTSVPLEQRQINIEPENLTNNVQGEDEIKAASPQLVNNDVVSQPINLLQQEIVSMNLFNGSNVQRSEDQRLSDQVQNKDNLISHDFMSMGLFSSDNSQHDQQICENHATNPRTDGILSKDSRKQNTIPIGIDEITNTDIFTIKNETEMQNSKSDPTNGSTSTHFSNRSMVEINFGDKNKIDPKENIRKILENKNFLSTKITYDKDLAQCIPGVYRLLDLCKDDGSNGLGTFLCYLTIVSFCIS